jgi:predicted nucleic acid-binding protein
MILLDTSVLITHFRHFTFAREMLLNQHQPYICGPVRAEFLSGGRDPQKMQAFQLAIRRYQTLSVPETLWELAGQTQALLGSCGVTVPLMDTVIAVIAIHHHAELWAHDQHFQRMANFLPTLKLYHEP